MKFSIHCATVIMYFSAVMSHAGMMKLKRQLRRNLLPIQLISPWQLCLNALINPTIWRSVSLMPVVQQLTLMSVSCVHWGKVCETELCTFHLLCIGKIRCHCCQLS